MKKPMTNANMKKPMTNGEVARMIDGQFDKGVAEKTGDFLLDIARNNPLWLSGYMEGNLMKIEEMLLKNAMAALALSRVISEKKEKHGNI